MSVNRAILVGRLGKDPELKYTPAGRAVCNFSMATDRRWTGQDGEKNRATTWHNLVAWGKQAEIIKEYLGKGHQLYVEGRIDNRSYDDKDGNKKYISEVVVESFSFIGSRGDDAPQGNEPQTPNKSTEAESDDDMPF